MLIVRIGQSLNQAYQAADHLVQVISGPALDDRTYPLAESFMNQTIQALGVADTNLNWLRPLTTRLTWLPQIGPTISAAPTLLHVGVQLADIGNQFLVVAEPQLKQSTDSTTLTRLPMLLASASQKLPQLEEQIADVQAQLATIPEEQLLSSVAQQVKTLQAGIAIFHAALKLNDQLPKILGNEERQRYLVLVQNNYELRASGGFITAIGLLTVHEGKVISFEAKDSYDAPDGDGPFPLAPLPMQRYMHIDSLLLRDVNWSPDLPTTAQLAVDLYGQSTGLRVDGVITLDLRGVELFVEALQPLSVPGNTEPITAQNVVAQSKAMWAMPPTLKDAGQAAKEKWWKQRKDFIPLLATALLNRMQSGGASTTAIATAFYQAMQERALQIWSREPAIENALADLGWDGSVKPPKGEDFLALVDANMGYNKVDAVMERALTYQVQWKDGVGQPAVATVLITYRHQLSVPGHLCDARPQYGDQYDDMMARCYFDFVRLYAPAGSALIAINGLDPASLINQHGEGGSEVFGGYLVVKPGEEKQVVMQYRLPASIQRQGYRLTIRKQSGVPQLPFNGWIAGVNLDGEEFEALSQELTIQDGLFIWDSAKSE
ncbi:MAG: DUF4012 domain-containing protein [Caldilineaceae bacterium]